MSAERQRKLFRSSLLAKKEDKPDETSKEDTPAAVNSGPRSKRKNKIELMKAVGEEMKKQKRESEEESSRRLLDQINPFKAGQSLRRTIGNAFRGETSRLKQSKYYLEDDDIDESYVPEVLVVGATGATGQLIVRQLLLRNCRVRVLVRDLYTDTLNKLGTSVTYCQGDLLRPDTLEYATTDVDKIVFCASAEDYGDIDQRGMLNLVNAYQNVRHADYGTPQAAKRSLFRFQQRVEDFCLFETDSKSSQWFRNDFQHGVFCGKGPSYLQSSRLQSRDDADLGIDFGPSFAGFICRICSDGQTYQAVIQANNHEYTCQFSTRRKYETDNKSRNKFTTVRLPFENFVCEGVPKFDGTNIRHIGFRYPKSRYFYLALDYVKLFRSQPEPEFVYLSDARIPRKVENSMIKIEEKQLAINDEVHLFDDTQARNPEATFYKYVGEEIVKKSGLSYSIIRVNGFSDGAADASAISLLEHRPESDAFVSRADVAQICAQALLDPAALNKSFYVTPSNRPTTDDLSRKLAALPLDDVA